VVTQADRNVTEKDEEKKLKYKSLYTETDTTNLEHGMYDSTGNKWSQRNSNKRFKEKFGSCTRKTFDTFTTKDSCTWNITFNTESPAV
jgi:hypothetical protein